VNSIRRLSEPPIGLDPSRPASRLERITAIAPGFADAARAAIAHMHARALAEQDRERAELRRPVPADPNADFGPEHRLRRRRVVVVEALDPNQPAVLIRRAVVADPIANMVSRGHLQQRHLDAAEILRGLIEVTGHAPVSSIARIGMPASPSGPPTSAAPADAARALAQLDRAWRACWPYGPVVAWVALGRNTVDGFARARRVRKAEVGPWLRQGLTLLADHFGCVSSSQHS